MAYEWLADCNTKNLKARGDYGVRVARPGFDARTCADNQLIFNSGWPILQVCDVIDFDDGAETYTRYLKSNYTWTNTLPSGYTLGYSDTTDTRWGKFGVNDKYCRMYVRTDYYHNSSYDEITAVVYKRKRHYLNYVPFFLSAEDVSGTASSKILLFSVDIRTDVDYPYTDMALPLISVPDDYGMKSESIFGPKVPGLSTGQFSKLVQAVKTEETAKYDIRARSGIGEGDGKASFWSPLDSAPGYLSKSPLIPFEAFAFAITGETNWNNMTAVYDTKDGGYFVNVGVMSMADGGSNIAYAYSNVAPVPPNYMKESLVILRSPMVSPELVEVSG